MFKINFMANQSVTDEDINAIGYNLANTVYTSFENGVTYGIDELNEITAHLVTKGVKREYGNMCAVSLNGTTVTIHSGQVFFENGATMTIDEEGISLELEDATHTNYVYLFHNTSLNVAGARCTTETPSGVDVILLAEITDGVVTQNIERFCKSKVLDAPNTPLVIYNSQEIGGNYYSDPLQAETETVYIKDLSKYDIKQIEIEYAFFNYSTKVWNNYEKSILAKVKSGNTHIVDYSDYNQWYTGSIDLFFDYEMDTISIAVTEGAKIDKNKLKITLYAGEVQ